MRRRGARDAKCWSHPATPARRPNRRCATSTSRPKTSRRWSQLAARERVDLTIIGPEGPLVAGIVDAFAARGLACFGPRRAPRAARGLQGLHQGVPAPPRHPHRALRDLHRARASMPAGVRAQRAPLVVKASGLAAGKGVVIAPPSRRRSPRSRRCSPGQFGAAGERGGDRGIPRRARRRASSSWPTARTSCRSRPRRITSACEDGDRGPNTGGMGAYSPAPVVTPALHARIMREVIEPAIRGLAAEGMPYTGFLYAGHHGRPRRHAQRARIQLPPRRPGNAADPHAARNPISRAVRGGARRPPRPACAPRGMRARRSASSWPRPAIRSSVRKGDVIEGLERAARLPGKIFHAGTQLEAGPGTHQRRPRAVRGRPRAQTSRRRSARPTRSSDSVRWPGMQYRRDIGYRAVRARVGRRRAACESLGPPAPARDRARRVRAADIDAYGHVNNAVYLTWLDRVAWSHSAALGVPLERLHAPAPRHGGAAHRDRLPARGAAR